MPDEKIKKSRELEFAVFCIENVAEKLGVEAERVYKAFTEKSNILNDYIVPEYEILHTQSRAWFILAPMWTLGVAFMSRLCMNRQ